MYSAPGLALPASLPQSDIKPPAHCTALRCRQAYMLHAYLCISELFQKHDWRIRERGGFEDARGRPIAVGHFGSPPSYHFQQDRNTSASWRDRAGFGLVVEGLCCWVWKDLFMDGCTDLSLMSERVESGSVIEGL